MYKSRNKDQCFFPNIEPWILYSQRKLKLLEKYWAGKNGNNKSVSIRRKELNPELKKFT